MTHIRKAVVLRELPPSAEGAKRSTWASAGGAISVQRIVEWLYAKTGVRYFESLVVIVIGTVLLFVVPGYIALLLPYFHATASQYARFVGAFEIALCTAGVGLFIIAMRRHAALRDWLRGHRGPDAATAAWKAAVTAVPGTTAIALTWCALWCIPPVLYVSSVAHLSWIGALLYLIFMVLLFTGTAVFAYLFFEQALSPVVREIAVQLPAQFEPPRHTPSLAGKVLLLLPAINIFTGIVVAAVSTNSLGMEGRLAVTLAATLLVSMTMSFVLTLMLRQSLLLRLRSLQEAIRCVDRGDFSARVLRLAGDELDEVGKSFNAMVSGLQERSVLRSVLSSYIDANIATQMLSEGEILEGREVEVTVLFLDIRDFTSLADRSSAAQVVAYLHEFFELVVPIIRGHRGHLNKLLGDGLLAVFGAPAPLENHADHALEAAAEILDAVRGHYRGELRIGIGMHTGEVIAGTVGGGGKLDYTLIGDTVNVAARVEELTKSTGDALLITESTRCALTDPRHSVQARGAHRLRGKARETPIYAVATSPRSQPPRAARKERTRTTS